jgi:hypothetical protein
MSHKLPESDHGFPFPRPAYWKRWLLAGLAFSFCVVFVPLVVLWNLFFHYVPPGKHLVIIAKDGEPLPAGEVLADEGQKGIQKKVLGEGWHFVLPIVYTTELADNTTIPPGKVGLVTALGGRPLAPGRILADEGEQGIQRSVLPPGAYRLNLHGYKVEPVDAIEIKPGYVGVRRRLQGKDGQGRFAAHDDEKGFLREVLQPGLYYVNPKEYEVIKAEVGIIQTSFHYDPSSHDNKAITFTSRGGFPINLDCTIEWEVRPEDMPALVAEYGSWKVVERTVIDLQAHAIGRDRGIDYGVQDFLEGSKREQFQDDFTGELTRVCKDKNVTVHSAFIRNIVIPEAYLKPIRDKQIAAETELTNRAKEVTAQSEAQVENEQRMIEQKVAEVEAETKRMVAAIDHDAENVKTRTENEVGRLKADYEAQIAALDAQRITVAGAAETEVTRLKETAKSGLYQLKLAAFHNDGDAFLRYSLADQLNQQMRLRLFHSGPGTFWTNLEGKGMNLLLPAPPAQAPRRESAAQAAKDK